MENELMCNFCKVPMTTARAPQEEKLIEEPSVAYNLMSNFDLTVAYWYCKLCGAKVRETTRREEI